MTTQQPQSKGIRLLLPATAAEKRIDPFRKAIITQVTISPNIPDGDVYPQAGKLALTKQALMKLASAAGLKITTRVVSSSRDYVCFEATVHYLNVHGMPQEVTGTKEIDMTVIEEEIRSRQKSEAAGTTELLQFRKHKMARAESGAINRAIRSVLSIQSAYTAAELKIPFGVPHTVFAPDFTDPDVKAIVMRKFADDSNMLYGGGQTSETVPLLSSPEVDVTEIHQIEGPENMAENNAETPEIEEIEPPDSYGEPEPETAAGEFVAPPCEACGGTTHFATGVSKKTGRTWYAYFCDDEVDCKHTKWIGKDPRPGADADGEDSPGY